MKKMNTLTQWIKITKSCQCDHFMYLNVGKHFTKEEVKDYFRK